MRGLVIRNTGSWYVVRTDDGQLVDSKIKGNFRLKGIRSTNPVAVGDFVQITVNAEGTAFITEIEDRKNYIIRKASNLSKQSHIIAANVDQAFLIVTVSHPETSTNPMFRPGDKMLAVMPMFHGFGLGVSIHSMLVNGGCCILVPRFTPDSYAKLLLKYRCNLIAGVPTLYEALLRLPKMKNADLSCLKGVYSGGDSLSVELKKRFDQFLFDHHATIQVREGYGLTECVTASCLTPYHISREGSIGIPFPDTYYKIVEHGTQKEVPYGTEGEICLSGPTVMMGYLHHPEETAQTLQTHEDGLTWVHTGDLGYMDPDGFVYFRQRLKRMIVTSGYNVYPSQMENILDAHELVQMSCVIGVPDPLKMQKVKAFVMLKPGVPANEETKAVLMAYIRKNVAKYALPYDIEFRAELPKTLVGKVAYRVLEEEELKKLSETAQEQ